MATKKEYLEFILDQLSGLPEITYRMLMGEYIIYYREKIAAYVCDDRFLVKPVESITKAKVTEQNKNLTINPK